MKRVIALLLAVAMMLSLSACANNAPKKEEAPAEQETAAEEAAPAEEEAPAEEAAQDLLAQIKERGYITIATEGNWAPWTYHDEDDNLVGLDIEIGQLIADGLGVKADFKETNWDSILAGVSSGRFDIACNGVGYSEERAQSFTFSDPYVYDRTVLVVRDDNTDITSFEDLAGKNTTNSPNSLYAQQALDLGAEVTYVDTLNETLSMVIDGRADATLNAEVSINDYMKEHPDAPLKVVCKGQGAPIAYPVMKDPSTDTLIAEINRILAEARDSGKLAEISMKYFDLDLTTP
ncbi:MAG: transporter substrate-binding domain-containing protein [Firmicutes bacterium]|nr:transporter substrate-binding domain-containing protein [Bacillota bacterium]